MHRNDAVSSTRQIIRTRRHLDHIPRTYLEEEDILSELLPELLDEIGEHISLLRIEIEIELVAEYLISSSHRDGIREIFLEEFLEEREDIQCELLLLIEEFLFVAFEDLVEIPLPVRRYLMSEIRSYRLLGGAGLIGSGIDDLVSVLELIEILIIHIFDEDVLVGVSIEHIDILCHNQYQRIKLFLRRSLRLGSISNHRFEFLFGEVFLLEEDIGELRYQRLVLDDELLGLLIAVSDIALHLLIDDLSGLFAIGLE